MTTQDQFPAIQQIVSRQLRRWQSEQLAHQEGEHAPPHVGGPFLTLSREPGAGALEIGRTVAEHLGAPELAALATRRSAVRPSGSRVAATRR